MTAKQVLTPEQKRAARRLLEMRPHVLPGTRVIVGDKIRQEWYDLVTLRMRNLGVSGAEQVNAFCNLAGVPD